MQNADDQEPKQGNIEFVATTGTTLMRGSSDKQERIVDAMVDMHSAIAGCAVNLERIQGARQFQQSFSALARSSSIFLRKLVLGDENRRETRLLDDAVCEKTDIGFHRLRRIPKERRTLNVERVIDFGFVRFEKLDDESREPVSVHEFPVGPQSLKLSIDWPVPGAADWDSIPTFDNPWQIRASQLFDLDSPSDLDCANWLGQQLVMFDNRGVSLRDVIRVTANIEGAHSINASRFAQVEGERVPRYVADQNTLFLSSVTFGGTHYNHVIVVEAALYLYEKLIDSKAFERPEGEVVLPTFCVFPETSDGLFAANPKWLGFDGGFMISIGGGGQTISHRIRATG